MSAHVILEATYTLDVSKEVNSVIQNDTAKYTKIDSGYMVLAYVQQGKELPSGNCLIEQVPTEIDHVRETA